MKIKKNKIELTIKDENWELFKVAGWKKKRERTPEKRREIYLKSKEEGKLNND